MSTCFNKTAGCTAEQINSCWYNRIFCSIYFWLAQTSCCFNFYVCSSLQKSRFFLWMCFKLVLVLHFIVLQIFTCQFNTFCFTVFMLPLPVWTLIGNFLRSKWSSDYGHVWHNPLLFSLSLVSVDKGSKIVWKKLCTSKQSSLDVFTFSHICLNQSDEEQLKCNLFNTLPHCKKPTKVASTGQLP